MPHKFEDKVISLFNYSSSSSDVNTQSIANFINKEITKSSGSQKNFDIVTFYYCRDAVTILSDLVKLETIFRSSRDVKVLNDAIDEKFLSGDEFGTDEIRNIKTLAFSVASVQDLISNPNYKQCKYKNVALKCIIKCNKLLLGLHTFKNKLDQLRSVIQRNMRGELLITDSMTLLLQLWFHLLKTIRILNVHVVCTFIKAKCLLINFELTLLLDYVTYHFGSDANVNGECFGKVQVNLQKTIKSFNSFISNLISSLETAEGEGDDKLFGESLDAFLDIEVMYNQLNFDWLISTEQSSKTKDLARSDSPNKQLNLPEQINELSLDDEVSEIHKICENIDEITDLLPGSETYKNASSNVSQERGASITKQLPSLLHAFNNLKELENDVRPTRVSTHQSPSAYETEHKARTQSMSSSVSASSTLFSRDTTSERDHSEYMFSSFMPSMLISSSSPGASAHSTSPENSMTNSLMSSQILKNDFKKLLEMQQLQQQELFNKTIPTKESFAFGSKIPLPTAHGFHNTLLNNIYGISDCNRRR
ncbi:Mdm36p KNAG_0A07370 [Huiozyma naganishii CBS 8797]|uniref:Uncharacterized protein n=1 Tax=Huiozyma naganishii (strain ATCC MYA-139 / BCRC 22969 / CBS 8797 / KCTC 17520 / NBRC 10181 / NCYC 3082 / Yp74L-3) TaxID=1071383 RepID=J7R0P8_HUIN7|nr:hypothetical protein KNAG_0A07370 [Kazachstania naganishii CBS 8797]CCK68390.1 hypothetical protein KNAG_0A07370 [Kazachstania naganishii CBS 8797]